MPTHPFLAEPPPVIELSTQAPLERVLVQVKFPPLHLREKQGLHVPFHDQLREIFPYCVPIQLMQIEWTPQGGEPRQVQALSPSFLLHTADRTWELTLADDFISLVTRRYDTRDEFRDRFRLAMASAADNLKIEHWSRIGLRTSTGAQRRQIKPCHSTSRC